MPDRFDVMWTNSAKVDLEELILYVSKSSKKTALNLLVNIETSACELASFPEKGRIVAELENINIRKYRELLISPWRIFYKIEKSTVYIMAVIDGRRNIEDVLLRRNIR